MLINNDFPTEILSNNLSGSTPPKTSNNVVVINNSTNLDSNSQLNHEIITNGKRLAAAVLSEKGEFCEKEAYRYTASIAGAFLFSNLDGVFAGHGVEDQRKLSRLQEETNIIKEFQNRIQSGEKVTLRAEESLRLQKQIIDRVSSYTQTSRNLKLCFTVGSLALRAINVAQRSMEAPSAILGEIAPVLMIFGFGEVSALFFHRYISHPNMREEGVKDSYQLLAT